MHNMLFFFVEAIPALETAQRSSLLDGIRREDAYCDQSNCDLRSLVLMTSSRRSNNGECQVFVIISGKAH